ncbi:MAG: hypothetical protein PWQ55_891 [Chloroflexota bacterium]|nr:hypothetical protein [Chloroflexota bacterium]
MRKRKQFIQILLIFAIGLAACSQQTKQPQSPSVHNATLTATTGPTETPAPTPTITPTPTPAATATPDWLPIFDQFIADVKTGEAGRVVGIWVEGVLALEVVYQPATNPGYVSTDDEIATYFLYPWQKAGNHGLLAHNYLAGRYFFNLQVGDIISLVWGDGNYEDFEITQIKDFQALQPDNPYSNFIDLDSGEQLTVNNVFLEVYMGDYHTTLQTCIAQGNETEWGRQFVLAPPLY